MKMWRKSRKKTTLVAVLQHRFPNKTRRLARDSSQNCVEPSPIIHCSRSGFPESGTGAHSGQRTTIPRASTFTGANFRLAGSVTVERSGPFRHGFLESWIVLIPNSAHFFWSKSLELLRGESSETVWVGRATWSVERKKKKCPTFQTSVWKFKYSCNSQM